MSSVLIRNGLVIDGTGREAFPADVLVEGDRIADVIDRPGINLLGRVRSPSGPNCTRLADTVIDAAGCLVTPGFVDAHAHSDTYLLIEPDAPSKLSQGITTEVNGQCGGSAVPRYGAARLSSDWASMTYPGGDGTPGPTWRSMAEYRALLDQVRPAINTVQFVGHNTLRSSVIGYDAVRATPETLRAMEDLLARELDDGGWGLTTGLIYQPGKYSDAAEVTALARVASARGGFYATHMRSEGDAILEAIDEVLDLVRATGIRAEISHLKTSGRRNWGKIDDVLAKIERAVGAGELLGSDRYPYCAAGTDLDVVFPDWAGEGGVAAEIERLKDPATRARIAAEIDAQDRDWSTVMIGGTWAEATRHFSGQRINELIAAGAGRPPYRTPGELVCAILAADACRTGAFFFGMSEANLQKILARPWIVPGSDASLRAPHGPLGKDHPHPRAYGTMPRFFRLLTGRVEGHARICSREAAIQRMTSVPAARFNIRDRGVIRPGAYADLAVWREEEFRETATYTAPHAYASGMQAVLVNGAVAYRAGKFANDRRGRFLERS
ncbi:MAG: D-aminoacylase [Kiritimatiellae bacterium]|nr:D-aminoacylase [Kiritimatiellia bacterium]